MLTRYPRVKITGPGPNTHAPFRALGIRKSRAGSSNSGKPNERNKFVALSRARDLDVIVDGDDNVVCGMLCS